MGFENPFRKPKIASVPEEEARTATPEEVAEANARYERAQTDGLTDEQRTALENFEQKLKEPGSLYAEVGASIGRVKAEATRIRALPAGSREKYDAAFALRNAEIETLDLPLAASPMFWESSDPIAVAAAQAPRYQEVKARLDALRTEKDEAKNLILELQREVTDEYRQAA